MTVHGNNFTDPYDQGIINHFTDDEIHKIKEAEDKIMEEKLHQIVVKYKEDEAQDIKGLMAKPFSTMISNINPVSPGVDIITIKDKDQIDDVVENLKKDKNIEFAEKNQIQYLYSYPSDTYYGNQWWLSNIDTPKAWEEVESQKKEVVVAVIDSGLDTTHEDLKNRIASGGYDFYNNSSSIYDLIGHGTNVAGVIAAETDNMKGIAGVSGKFNVKILPLRVARYDGTILSIDVIRAINYAIDKNVDVINLSLGGPDYLEAYNSAIQRAVNSDIIVVASAGNDADKGNPIQYPASYPNVLSVGSIDRNYNWSYFSNYNRFVDIVAPGEYIFTTSPYDDYGYNSGTSFSAPMVSGAAAIIKGLDPEASADQVADAVCSTAKDLGSTGYDPYYGYGALNVYKAISKFVDEPVLIPVNGVKLDKSKITMKINGSQSTAQAFMGFDEGETQKAEIDSLKSMSSSYKASNNITINRNTKLMDNPVIYESEPNNDTPYSDKIFLDYNVYGTITGTHDDIDCYELKIENPGKLSILGIWASGLVADLGWEDDLAIHLYDSYDNLITIGECAYFDDGTAARSLNANVVPGTYYIIVFQSSGYEYVYTDEAYAFTCWMDIVKEPDAESINLNVTQKFMKKGEYMQLIASISPVGAAGKVVKWASSNSNIVAVDSNGKVTASGRGRAVISASVDGKAAECVIKVTDDAINPTEALFETVLPENATNKNVSWKSSNINVAAVDAYGIVTAKSPGKAVITVATSDGGYASSCEITVEKAIDGWIDYKTMQAKQDKEFAVEFNLPLNPQYVNINNIYVADDLNGINKSYDAICRINAANPKIINVLPDNLWKVGEHYIFISNRLRSVDGKLHNKNLRIKFIVTE